MKYHVKGNMARHYSTYRKRKLKRPSTPQEAAIWSYLAQRKTGFKCTRQYDIGDYYVDFAFPDIRLVVEICDYERSKRAKHLEARGWIVQQYTHAECDEAYGSVVAKHIHDLVASVARERYIN